MVKAGTITSSPGQRRALAFGEDRNFVQNLVAVMAEMRRRFSGLRGSQPSSSGQARAQTSRSAEYLRSVRLTRQQCPQLLFDAAH